MKSKIYNKVRTDLARHKEIAFFLSHGALHIITLIVLSSIVIYMGVYVYLSSIPNNVVFDTSIKFLDKNNVPIESPVTFLNIRIKPDTTESDHYIITNYVNHFSPNGLPEDASDSHVLLTWLNYFPNGQVRYHLHGLPKIRESLGKCTRYDNGYTVEFYNYNSFIWYPMSTSGNLLGGNIKNPYYSTFFKINCGNYELKESSEISVELSDYNYTIITFDNIVPSPSEIGINKFSYKGKESVEAVLSNGGFYFKAENTTKVYKAERMNLIYNILIGTLTAFILDIIITLIYKWRRLI